MSKSVTIPTNLGYENSMTLYINGKTYNYTPGETVTVPDEVAALIEDMQRSMPQKRNEDAPSVTTPDWSENDPSSGSYIKNRVCYVRSETELFNSVGKPRIVTPGGTYCYMNNGTLPDEVYAAWIDGPYGKEKVYLHHKSVMGMNCWGFSDWYGGLEISYPSVISIDDDLLSSLESQGVDTTDLLTGNHLVCVDAEQIPGFIRYTNIRIVDESVQPIEDRYIPDSVVRTQDLEALEARVAALEGV